MSHALGIDLGGTKIEGIALDPEGRELARPRIATEAERGYDHIISRITELYATLCEAIADEPHGLGIGTPGSVSPRTGEIRNSNTTCLNGRRLADDLRATLGHPLTLANDADCFALAEARRGAGRGHDLVFGVILGTGCGGGIVHRGRLLAGRDGIAGEWGHHAIDPRGPLCWCGERGCVETLISGGGLERRWRERQGEARPASELFAAWRRGEERATAFVEEFFAAFGRALANLIDILDPDLVVLGGGLSNVPELYGRGAAEVHRRVFSDACDTPIVRHELGDSAGVVGAALVGAADTANRPASHP